MPKEEWEKKYEKDDFGMNAKHGAEKMKCADCIYRQIYTWPNGRVLDTGKGATCKKYPTLKPMNVLSDNDADCPNYKKDNN